MEIAWNDEDLKEYMSIIQINKQEHPILVDKYLYGKEFEVDAICDGKDVLIPGIMEHIERPACIPETLFRCILPYR